MKYKVPKGESEGEVLPNKLGLTTKAEIERSEFEGFLSAYTILFDELNSRTKFDLKYLLKIHKLALGHLYTFAGKSRTVNISKGGFMFSPALALDNALKEFDKTILKKLPTKYRDKDELIKHIALVHAELLFIHPFREWNGRTTRLLANLMAGKAGYKLLDLENFSKTKFDSYVMAVRMAANKNYEPMEKIIRSLF